MSDYSSEGPSPSTDTLHAGPSSDESPWTLEGVSFIDKLGLQYSLTPEQLFDLKALHHLGSSLPGNLTSADLMTRVFVLACHFGSERRLHLALQSTQASSHESEGVNSLRGLFNELSIRLDDSFHLTKEQKMSIRRTCQDQIIYLKPLKAAYKDLHVAKKIRTNPGEYRMDNIFGRGPARKAQFVTDTKRISSNVRNVYRQDLRDSVIGSKQISLKKFIADCVTKYLRAPMSNNAEQLYVIQAVLLHRFAFENKSLLGEDDSSDSEDLIMDSTDAPSKKRKRSSPGKGKGRIPNGTDFWSQVDTWFEKLKEKYASEDFSSSAWKGFIEESHQLDQQRYDAFAADGSGSSTMTFTTAAVPNTPPVASTSTLPPQPPAFSRPPTSFALFDGLIQSQTRFSGLSA
ncbi:hypothetical protein BDZ97DRAFT_1931715 [Flammula alnicola]|nr:hypothetical protein BDZ97DRAFT_1931715 [Flammula alnicola]